MIAEEHQRMKKRVLLRVGGVVGLCLVALFSVWAGLANFPPFTAVGAGIGATAVFFAIFVQDEET